MKATKDKWMQRHDIYDPELEILLQDFNVNTEEDLKNLKQKEWDEIWRQAFVERVKAIKQQKAKQRLENKMKKLEKLWRKASGSSAYKSAKQSDISQLASTSVSNSYTEYAIKEAPELKSWLKTKGIWLKDLFEVLVEKNISSPDDFFLILDQTMEEIKREVRVRRAQELKSNDAKLRLENILKKFEDEWRKSEGKQKNKKVLYDDTKEPPTPSETSKQAAFNELAEKGKALKDWMRSKGIWQQDLFEVVVKYNVSSPDDFFLILDETMEEIKREVRVRRAQELKSNDAKLRLEKILKKFEEEWRKSEGKQKNKKVLYDDTKEPPTPTASSKEAAFNELAEKGKALKDWMRSNGIWQLALYEELVANNVTGPDDLATLKQKDLNEITRKVKVDRFSEIKSQTARASAEKLLVKFEKLYKKKQKK